MPEGKPPTVRWLMIAVLGVAVVAVASGLLARQFYQPPGQISGQPAAPGEPTPPPGTRLVKATGDAARHPLYEPVREMLQRHFDSINDRSYQRWTETVTAARISATPPQRWFADYRTTRDGSVVVYRLEMASAKQARALIELVSVQEPGDAPPNLQVGCIRWHVVYPLAEEDGGWKIDGGPTGASAQLEKC